jgi:hypothetical protein
LSANQKPHRAKTWCGVFFQEHLVRSTVITSQAFYLRFVCCLGAQVQLGPQEQGEPLVQLHDLQQDFCSVVLDIFFPF